MIGFGILFFDDTLHVVFRIEWVLIFLTPLVWITTSVTLFIGAFLKNLVTVMCGFLVLKTPPSLPLGRVTFFLGFFLFFTMIIFVVS